MISSSTELRSVHVELIKALECIPRLEHGSLPLRLLDAKETAWAVALRLHYAVPACAPAHTARFQTFYWLLHLLHPSKPARHSTWGTADWDPLDPLEPTGAHWIANASCSGVWLLHSPLWGLPNTKPLHRTTARCCCQQTSQNGPSTTA